MVDLDPEAPRNVGRRSSFSIAASINNENIGPTTEPPDQALRGRRKFAVCSAVKPKCALCCRSSAAAGRTISSWGRRMAPVRATNSLQACGKIPALVGSEPAGGYLRKWSSTP